MTRIFNLIPADRGRPLTDIAHSLDYEALHQDIQQVFGARQPIERRASRRDATAHYIVRVLPYWTGAGKVDGAVLTFADVTTLATAESQQRVLVAELNHRVKNMLTIIVSIATQTLKGSESVEEFGQKFLDRVHAMARSYELVSRDQWSTVPLRAVLQQVLEPYLLDAARRAAMEGPEVSLKPKIALSLGMIFHELGTNAVKYGSLSVGKGSLDVTWALERRSGAQLVIDWTERGGPSPNQNPDRGFGLNLIEREVTHGLNGKVRLIFENDGLRANMKIPIELE